MDGIRSLAYRRQGTSATVAEVCDFNLPAKSDRHSRNHSGEGFRGKRLNNRRKNLTFGKTNANTSLPPIQTTILARRWGNRAVAMSRVNIAAFALLLVGLLLTFPPFMDFLQGR
ncbi:hypothetical protein [Mesorhizobium sp. WSM4884]|uniref:hypothetical protein n=1 Tax=Mesorhizobium sp. WSM4884 TaxID=3038542 RepID=UPI002415FD01|nr:hypothetical protein [Mesorhizobium sp. WSM4884]MDG4881930.1 hypothetical protein [Mesorhizobium sp. WSM4884]